MHKKIDSPSKWSLETILRRDNVSLSLWHRLESTGKKKKNVQTHILIEFWHNMFIILWRQGKTRGNIYYNHEPGFNDFVHHYITVRSPFRRPAARRTIYLWSDGIEEFIRCRSTNFRQSCLIAQSSVVNMITQLGYWLRAEETFPLILLYVRQIIIAYIKT